MKLIQAIEKGIESYAAANFNRFAEGKTSKNLLYILKTPSHPQHDSVCNLLSQITEIETELNRIGCKEFNNVD